MQVFLAANDKTHLHDFLHALDGGILQKTRKILAPAIIFTFLCYTLCVGAFNFSAKNVNGMAHQLYACPSGELIGVKLYTKGLLVIETAEFYDVSGDLVSPGRQSGLMAGDVILTINGEEITSIENFQQAMENLTQMQIEVEFVREYKQLSTTILPKQDAADNQYKIGTWVRDSTAGVGTMSFVIPETGQFYALGHGIVDADVGAVYNIRGGSVHNVKIIAVQKGKTGLPGELRGVFLGDDDIGSVDANGHTGLVGTFENTVTTAKIPIASKEEVHAGKATILSTVDEQTIEYEIEIERVLPFRLNSSKELTIKITDPRLLERTGGIVQGMSGSPIVQDGKLIGAITYVFVNDPTRGYAILAQTMINGE